MKKRRTSQLRHQVASTRRRSVSAPARRSLGEGGFFSLRTRICLAVICAVATSAHANIITVTNTNDSGPGSLRQALADANDGDTIDLCSDWHDCADERSNCSLNKSITISGPGADILAVNGNATYRVFHIAPGRTVGISGLTYHERQGVRFTPTMRAAGILQSNTRR